MSATAINAGSEAPSQPIFSRLVPAHQQALERCIAKLHATLPIIGLRSPKIGRPDLTWTYCGPFDWVSGFFPGQLWLAFQLTGDPRFANNAAARKSIYHKILQYHGAQNHDLGFQFSLSCVAEYMMTGNEKARELALAAAASLASRFNIAGRYIQAWNPYAPENTARSEFVAGRVIVDSMENMALLNWAYTETGRMDFKTIASAHATTVMNNHIRPDKSSYHCYLFDPVTGTPVKGVTHQGYADQSCWSRGQGWLIHGFAQCYFYTGNKSFLDASLRLAIKAEEMLGDSETVPYDYLLPPGVDAPVDSSAAAVTAAGAFMLAAVVDNADGERMRSFGDRLLAGLLKHSDITGNPDAHGFLDHGASHVAKGLSRAMLPYGDYYFMEALMRSLGHDSFFW